MRLNGTHWRACPVTSESCACVAPATTTERDSSLVVRLRTASGLGTELGLWLLIIRLGISCFFGYGGPDPEQIRTSANDQSPNKNHARRSLSTVERTQWPINPPLLSSSHSPSFSPPSPPERCKVSQQVWNRVMN